MKYEHAYWWLFPFSVVRIPSVYNFMNFMEMMMMIITGASKSPSCSLLCVFLSSFAQLVILYTIPQC